MVAIVITVSNDILRCVSAVMTVTVAGFREQCRQPVLSAAILNKAATEDDDRLARRAVWCGHKGYIRDTGQRGPMTTDGAGEQASAEQCWQPRPAVHP